MAHAEDIGRAHDRDLEPVLGGIGLEDQFLRRLGVAVGVAAAERKILLHHAVGGRPAPVIGAEGGDVEQPPDAGEPDRLADGDGAVDVDVHAEMERLAGALADQPGGVQHGVGAVFLDRRQHPRQMARILGDQRVVARAEPPVEIIGARERVEKHHFFAAVERADREAGADQPGTGDYCRHRTSLSGRGAAAPIRFICRSRASRRGPRGDSARDTGRPSGPPGSSDGRSGRARG